MLNPETLSNITDSASKPILNAAPDVLASLGGIYTDMMGKLAVAHSSIYTTLPQQAPESNEFISGLQNFINWYMDTANPLTPYASLVAGVAGAGIFAFLSDSVIYRFTIGGVQLRSMSPNDVGKSDYQAELRNYNRERNAATKGQKIFRNINYLLMTPFVYFPTITLISRQLINDFWK